MIWDGSGDDLFLMRPHLRSVGVHTVNLQPDAGPGKEGAACKGQC